MGAWITFLKERLPLPSYLVLVVGLAISGNALGGAVANEESAAASWGATAIAAAGAFLFFAVLRIMDELKDYEKDKIAHPHRPLPRGLIAVEQVAVAVKGLAVAMLLFSVVVGLANRPAGISYLLVTGYLWLMYREFYAGSWLASRPLLYAASHQVIILPLCYFCVLAGDPAAWRQLQPAFLGITVLGAFFAYEICRKLDPDAHPLLQTYLSHYGPAKTLGLTICMIALSAVGALGLGLGQMLWPLEGILIALLSLLLLAPNRFKIIEHGATISLALHVWAVPLATWLRSTG